MTAVGRLRQDIAFPNFVLGMQGVNGDFGLFQRATINEEYGPEGFTYGYSMWRSPVYQIGKPFEVLQITLTFNGGLPSGTFGRTVVPKVYLDNGNIVAIGENLDAQEYDDYPVWGTDDQTVQLVLSPKNFGRNLEGTCNFFLQLEFFGSGLKVVKLPITIDLEIHEQ